ncbi:uncharacterized protein [Chelonus insularis]|uniref:uncharacterized protein n=1 Tax=Chelonus insularis TaxID=460826 RepID=UPI00158F4B62|nr:uncharacterized protein LOC118067867 [Chelonus insularis]
MPREVTRRHSSSQFQWDEKENVILTITPKKKNYANITIRKLKANHNPSKNVSPSCSTKAFNSGKISVFQEKLIPKAESNKEITHSQKNSSVQGSKCTVHGPKRARLKRSLSEKILPLIEVYEKVNHHELCTNKDVSQFLHKRIKQLKTAENFSYEIETPIGVLNKPIPYTPVKVKHRRSKLLLQKSAVNITAQLFQYSDDIIQFYEGQEFERKRIFSGLKYRPVLSNQWKNSVHNIVILAVKLHFPPALSYHAIRIMDDLLSMGVLNDVPPRLVEITALWLIAKKDYLYSKLPTIEEVIEHSNYFFTLKELIDCEWKILKNLNFHINYPDLISIIMYNVKTYYGCEYTNVNFSTYYYVGAYMLDILLFNQKIIQKSSLLIAGVISSLTKILINDRIDCFDTKEIDHWIPDRIKLAFPAAEKKTVIENLILGIKRSISINSPENIVFKKYQKMRYNQIATVIKKKFCEN